MLTSEKGIREAHDILAQWLTYEESDSGTHDLIQYVTAMTRVALKRYVSYGNTIYQPYLNKWFSNKNVRDLFVNSVFEAALEQIRDITKLMKTTDKYHKRYPDGTLEFGGFLYRCALKGVARVCNENDENECELQEECAMRDDANDSIDTSEAVARFLAMRDERDNIIFVLLEKGYTQEEIATRLGISQQSISKRKQSLSEDIGKFF